MKAERACATGCGRSAALDQPRFSWYCGREWSRRRLQGSQDRSHHQVKVPRVSWHPTGPAQPGRSERHRVVLGSMPESSGRIPWPEPWGGSTYRDAHALHIDLLPRLRHLAPGRWPQRYVGNAVYRSHAARYLAEDGVVGLQAGVIAEHDEELAAVGVGTGVGHGHGAPRVRQRHLFVVELVARSAQARAGGITALDDKTGHDAMEAHAVEVTVLRQEDEALHG